MVPSGPPVGGRSAQYGAVPPYGHLAGVVYRTLRGIIIDGTRAIYCPRDVILRMTHVRKERERQTRHMQNINKAKPEQLNLSKTCPST
jgi:hypothetical protein